MNTLERVRADLELGAECGVVNVNVADLSALLRAVEAGSRLIAANHDLVTMTGYDEFEAAHVALLEKDTQG